MAQGSSKFATGVATKELPMRTGASEPLQAELSASVTQNPTKTMSRLIMLNCDAGRMPAIADTSYARPIRSGRSSPMPITETSSAPVRFSWPSWSSCWYSPRIE